MTTYRNDTIRRTVLFALGGVRGPADIRYAQIVGILTALLEDDKEMVSAIFPTGAVVCKRCFRWWNVA